MKLCKFITSLLLFSSSNLFSQDVVLSQPNSFPLYTNPAMAGSDGGIRIIRATRLQWLNQDGGYVTNYFSYDQYSRDIRSGFGYESYNMNESNGMLRSWSAKISFSPSICVGKRLDDSLRQIVIKPAISLGYVATYQNWGQVSFGDQIDPTLGFIYNTMEIKNKIWVIAPDLGAGALVYGKKFCAGFSLSHLTQPDMSFISASSPLLMRMILHGGYLLNFKGMENFTLCPSFVYQRQAGIQTTDITMTGTYRMFILGISERFGRAVVFMAGFQYRFFKIGYSYDLATTKAARAFGATHEIALGFNFANRKSHKKIRTLDFPAL